MGKYAVDSSDNRLWKCPHEWFFFKIQEKLKDFDDSEYAGAEAMLEFLRPFYVNATCDDIISHYRPQMGADNYHTREEL